MAHHTSDLTREDPAPQEATLRLTKFHQVLGIHLAKTLPVSLGLTDRVAGFVNSLAGDMQSWERECVESWLAETLD